VQVDQVVITPVTLLQYFTSR